MDLSHLNILIADDSRSTRLIAGEILRAAGANGLRFATDGGDAFAQISERAPDLLIMDMEMPLDGLTALRQLRRAQSVAKALPVIMMTAHSAKSKIALIRDAGADEILSKPFSASSLLYRVHVALNRRRPFVECDAYVGPDRRRRNTEGYQGPFRRAGEQPDDAYIIASA